LPSNDKETGKYPRIVFMLDENIRRVFEGNNGPWLTGYKEKPLDLPMDWDIEDKRFVIVNSLTRVVFGPFVQTKPIETVERGFSFVRKTPGLRHTFMDICKHIMEFAAAGDYLIRKGLPWEVAAKVLGVTTEATSSFRSIKVPNESFDRLADALEELNRHPYLVGKSLWQEEDIDEDYGFEDEELEYVELISQFYGTTDPQMIEWIAEADDRD
jgi:hypothetical protein